MVIIEIIGSISLVIACVSAIVLLIIYIKNKHNDITFIHNHTLNNILPSDRKMNCLQEENYQLSSAAVLPFEEIK